MTWAHGLGAALLFLGSTAAGFALRHELQQRAQLLAAVIDSLQLLRSDIVGRLLPLPEALRHTAETAPEPLHAQYTALADGITDSDRPFCEQWAAAIRALDMLTPAARAALLTLGAQLGKYDAQLQRQALDTCIASLRSISAALQDDARQRGKLVCGLGATLCSPPLRCFEPGRDLWTLTLSLRSRRSGSSSPCSTSCSRARGATSRRS